METTVSPVEPGCKTRKRTANPNNWKKNKAKSARYKPKALPIYPTCNHTEGKFLCSTLSMREVKKFHDRFYKNPDRQYQQNFILRYSETSNIQRRRPMSVAKQVVTDAKPRPSRLRTTKYFVRSAKNEKVPVSMEAFINILQVYRFRVNNLTKKYFNNEDVREKRGGFRRHVVFEPKKESIKKFINSLSCLESHYCSDKSQRVYVSAELNIKKLWRLYSSHPENIPVKESFFHTIFNTKYNIGFGSPRTDVCSTCLSLGERIKREKDPNIKNNLIMEKRVHSLKYKAFYKTLQDTDEDLLILSYDCQKNIPLPKVPDQMTYYSRQIYVQNFTIVRGHSKSKLDKNNVTSYCWTENTFRRDSDTISSCIFDSLNSIDWAKYKRVRLVSDGCAGQNKNSAIIAMLTFWLDSYAPDHIREIEIIYPVTGHSFLPPDRVFGNMEKVFKQFEVIPNPEEVYKIISNFATVKIVGEDCNVLGFKTCVNSTFKKTNQWHFMISKCKRVYVKRTSVRKKIAFNSTSTCTVTQNKITVRGEIAYLSDSTKYGSLFITGKTAKDITPVPIPATNIVRNSKQNDVKKLLVKHYGENWFDLEELQFFVSIMNGPDGPETDEGNLLCEAADEEPILIV